MTSEPLRPTPELSRLLSELADGQLDESGCARLDELLRDDPAARRLYLQAIDLEDTLAELPGFGSAGEGAFVRPAEPLAADRPAEGWRTLRQWAAAAAILLGGVWLGSRRGAPPELPAARPETVAASIRYVGELRESISADWGRDGQAPQVGEPLKAGRLVLRSGLAEIRFFSGAIVMLEGPADLELTSPDGGELRYGNLSADVPESAIGFTIRTPAGKVIDLGTRFGVRVAPDGATETHVFSGQVDVAPQGAKSAPPLRLTRDQAGRMLPAAAAVVPLTAAPRDFAHPTRRLTDLLRDGRFDEGTELFVGVPNRPGTWSGDRSRVVGPELGIRPQAGTGMVRFESASPEGDPFDPTDPGRTPRRTADLMQIVDLRGEARAAVREGATASVSAWFNRVAGDETTDTAFTLSVTSFKGDPAEVVATPGWGHSKARVSHGITEIVSDSDPRTWERAEVRLPLPPEADFVLVRLMAIENVQDDPNDNEFHGHFADEVSFTLTVGPRLRPLEPVPKPPQPPRKRPPASKGSS